MNYSENPSYIIKLNSNEFRGLNGKFKTIIEDNFLKNILIKIQIT